jgi:hypothetical protein
VRGVTHVIGPLAERVCVAFELVLEESREEVAGRAQIRYPLAPLTQTDTQTAR